MAGRLALCLVEATAGRLYLRPTAAGLCLRRAAGGTATTPVPLQASSGNLRTQADLPEVTLPTFLYRMIFKGYYNRLHELQLYEKQIYGPMLKMNIRGEQTINLSSAALLEELLRRDEKFPRRGDMTLWTEYRDMKGFGYGPFTEEGEKWYKLRAVLNKRMLHPKDSLKYENVVNDVITDFVKRIRYLCKISPTGDLVPNVTNELYRFSLEGISRILFETQIGCLENEIPAETQNFINSISQMQRESIPVSVLPKWTRNYLPFWKHYVAGWDGIFSFACKLIDRKMEDIQKRLDTNQEAAGEYLTYLLSNTKMSKKDVYGSVAELLLAGVETTSNTLLWALYLLSRDPKAQDILYQEVADIVKGDQIPAAQDINNMPYLKAVIKETLRMYPVVPVNDTSSQKRCLFFFFYITTFVIYHYAISQDETVFLHPQMFKPERWLRDGRERPHPFGSLPFGFGVRGCVGRRIAELEMHLALARVRNQTCPPSLHRRTSNQINRNMLVPDRQVNFHFLERKRCIHLNGFFTV
uniref:Cytochrome P450, family 27, subfamily A, polypeptide 1.1 n=1 Tax=Electrophorus electricus TaxID=8005 RepID=A0A4W4DV98_ELEEL